MHNFSQLAESILRSCLAKVDVLVVCVHRGTAAGLANCVYMQTMLWDCMSVTGYNHVYVSEDWMRSVTCQDSSVCKTWMSFNSMLYNTHKSAVSAGDESQLVVLVKAFTARNFGLAGTWRLPMTRKVHTANLDMLQQVTSLLNDQVTAPRAWRPAPSAVEEQPNRHLDMLRITAGFGS
jgi:hypothetical protein